MKKILTIMIFSLMFVCLGITPVVGSAEVADADIFVSDSGNIVTDVEPPTEPMTWEYLATIGGAAALTLLIVQFLKVPLDNVWKIPTRVFVYLVALIIMLVATAFTSGITPQTAILTAANAFLAALTAYGAYEVTFAKLNK